MSAAPALLGIDHVQVAAPPGCEEQARRFYGELLGLSELPKPEPLAARGGAWFACGDQELHVGVAGDFAPATKAHPAFRLADAAAVEALRARLASAGVALRDDHELPGIRRFYADDPWGNRLEFLAAAPAAGERR
jgi:catechol 2,3-dioxygenase-like lactoylglutathione lyase family enzyme